MASLARESIDKIPSLSQIIDLSGKVAVVAGGTYGLGYNVVYRYLEAGAQVVMNGRDAEKGAESLAEFKELGYGEDRIAFFAGDMSKVENCYALIDFAEKTFGKVDIMANILGLQHMSFFLDITEEEFDDMYSINAKSIYFLTQAASKSMIRNGIEGYIVNCSSVGSMGGDYVQGMMSHYSSSKAAVNGMSIALGRELAQYNIHLNTIAAGCMTTEGQGNITLPIAMKYGPLCARMDGKAYPDSIRSETPDDMARMFLVLSTPFAKFMVGEIISVDGGARFPSMPYGEFSLFTDELKKSKA